MTPAGAHGVGRAWDNYLWVPNYEDHTVSKIDVDTHEVVATIPVGSYPGAIAVGFQFVYVPCSLPASLYRIHKESDEVVDVVDLNRAMELPLGVAVDWRGNSFVVGRKDIQTSRPNMAFLLKVDSAGRFVGFNELELIESHPIAYVPDWGYEVTRIIGIGLNSMGQGFVPWRRGYTCNSGIFLFDTESLHKTGYPIDYHYYRGPGVCIDEAGNGWTAGARGGSHTANFTKLVPNGGISHYTIPAEFVTWHGETVDVLVDLQQKVWLSTLGGLFRLHPDTGEIDHFSVNAQWGAMGLDKNGYIWVTFPEDNQIKKFDPAGEQVGPAVDVGSYPLGYGDMTGYECVHPCLELDDDGDGYETQICDGTDCDDFDPEIYPGADEVCDGKDNDCNGQTDEGYEDADGDGSAVCVDCVDTDPDVNPRAEENCDYGIDDVCDGLIDPMDTDCAPEFVLDMGASYEEDMLSLSFILGNSRQATWTTALIVSTPLVQVIPLWSILLPAVYPPIEKSFMGSFPNVGWIGIYSGLTYKGEPQVYELDWVDTGS